MHKLKIKSRSVVDIWEGLRGDNNTILQQNKEIYQRFALRVSVKESSFDFTIFASTNIFYHEETAPSSHVLDPIPSPPGSKRIR
jgi:hypothetical protein